MMRWLRRLLSGDVDHSLFINDVNDQFALGDIDGALVRIDRAINHNSHPDLIMLRGTARYLQHDFPTAVCDCTEALEKGTTRRVDAFGVRALSLFALRQVDASVADFSRAIEITDLLLAHQDAGPYRDASHYYDLHRFRALALTQLHEDARSKEDLEVVLKGSRKLPVDFQVIALLTSVSSDSAIRNGEESVRYAEEAGTMAQWKEWSFYAILAAALAEAGNFEQAVHWATKALEMAPTEEKESRQERIRLYESHCPLRMSPVIDLEIVEEILPHRAIIKKSGKTQS